MNSENHDVLDLRLPESHLLMEQLERACTAKAMAIDELARALCKTNDAELIDFLFEEVISTSMTVKGMQARLESLLHPFHEGKGSL